MRVLPRLERRGLLDLNITFFPYEDAPVGVNGYGVSTRVYFSIPFDSVDYWVVRLKGVGLNVGEPRLSIPLYGFYSIKPPVGGSMYMVWDLVFKLFALILHRFSLVMDGSFHCILLGHKFMGTVSKGNVYKLRFMRCF